MQTTYAQELSSIHRDDLTSTTTAKWLRQGHTNLAKLAKKLRTKGLTTEAQYTTRTSNLMLSLSDAINDGSAKIEYFRDARTALREFDARSEELVALVVPPSEEAEKRRPLNWGEALEAFTDAMRGSKINDRLKELNFEDTTEISTDHYNDLNTQEETQLQSDITKAVRALGRRDRELMQRLPGESIEKFSVMHMPVIPMLERRLDTPKLNALGIKVSRLEDYPILEDQLILGVRTTYAKQWGLDVDEMIGQIMEQLRETTGQDVGFVSEDSSSVTATREFRYYWIMPEPVLTRTLSLLGPVNGWALALAKK